MFLRASRGCGERASFGVVAVDALENHAKGVDFCLVAEGARGCGDGARASDLRLAVGPFPHGTDGSEAEKFPNLDGRETGFGGGIGADSSFPSKPAATLLTDVVGTSVAAEAWDGARSGGGSESMAEVERSTGSVSGSDATGLSLASAFDC